MTWRFDPPIGLGAVLAGCTYLLAVSRYRSLRGHTWPRERTTLFLAGLVSGVLAIESPLDAAAERRFAPHMWQHLILTDLTAPLLLLGAPLLLALGASSPRIGRRIVAALRSRIGAALAFPLFGWCAFILSLWILHYSGFFEAALQDERLHVLEHAIYLGTALLFWLPVIAIGPTPWARGPLAFPLRMLYLFVAMAAEGMLGFSIYGVRHVLYPHYAAAGLGDQQAAGEIMWIGSTLVMFVAFMLVGYEWAVYEQRLGDRMNARLPAALDAAASRVR